MTARNNHGRIRSHSAQLPLPQRDGVAARSIPRAAPRTAEDATGARRRPRAGRRLALLSLLALALGLMVPAARSLAGERQFLVMLATSPKQFPGTGFPPDGLPNPTDIHARYFDRDRDDIGSFAEYWEEISYGDVTISGDVADWISLPWSIQPTEVSDGGPANWFDSNESGSYDYGASEIIEFGFAAVDVDTDGNPNGQDNGPFAPGFGTGSTHSTFGWCASSGAYCQSDSDCPQQFCIPGAVVWKPGERFVDMDGDRRWDGLDEANNQMDWDIDGKPDLRGPWVDLNENREPENDGDCVYLPDFDNDMNPNCCPNGPGQPGCGRWGLEADTPVLKGRTCPATSWNLPGGGEVLDCNGNLIPDVCDLDPYEVANADAAAACEALGWGPLDQSAQPVGWLGGPNPEPQFPGGEPVWSEDELPFGDNGEAQPDGIPDECQILGKGETLGYNQALRCVDPGNDQDPCIVNEDVRATTPRCEYDDGNGDDGLDIVEPFENFLRRWDPCIHDPDAFPTNRLEDQAHWVKVYDPSSGARATCFNPPHTIDYSDPSYIEDNYPGRRKLCSATRDACDTDADCPSCNPNDPNTLCLDPAFNICQTPVEELIANAGGRFLFGSHDPDVKIASIIDCKCAPTPFSPPGTTECLCGDLSCLLGDSLNSLPPDYLSAIDGITRACFAGMHVEYNPPDGWRNVTQENAPGGAAYSTKMQAAPNALDGLAEFVPNKVTEEPAWYEQAWEDRYRVPGAPSTPRPAPPWPTAPSGENILLVQPFVDDNADDYVPAENRRYFAANAGGTALVPLDPDDPDGPEVRRGLGFGWVGCDAAFDAAVLFETGAVPPLFADLCDAPILPEEVEGEDSAGIFFDGWVEHDDLASSKYHHAGDQRLGEVTSPFNNEIYGHDRGPHRANSIPNPDGFIPAAGPYAQHIHANSGFDGGNLLTMELLTWRTEPPFNDGAAWEQDLNFAPESLWRWHPYAGPWGANLGFRDYNLDGLIDQGESRYAGSENYLVDSEPGTRNNGTSSIYPFNRRRLLEDCVEVLDRLIGFDNFVDPVAQDAVECGGGTLATHIPVAYQGRGGSTTVFPKGIASGIVLLPNGSASGDDFPLSPGFYPIHNEDSSDPNSSFPADRAPPSEFIKWNLFFHDLVKVLGTPAAGGTRTPEGFETAYSAHEYLHAWEHFPDLYDYDIFRPDVDGVVVNTPIGDWGIMASGGLVHPAPILKEKPCTEWIEPIDLTSLLTPGVEHTMTLPSYEFVRDRSAYFLENENLLGERLYFYSVAKGFDEPGSVEGGMPGSGMLIQHTDVGADPEALPSGQTNGTRFQYLVVQADGLGQLDAGLPPFGDAGDPWPGATGARRFNFNTVPSATWYDQNSWTGIDIIDIVPDGEGSVSLTLSWIPTSLPSLRFVNPPGGASVNGVYAVNMEATDVYGGTTIEVYHTQDEGDLSILPGGANRIGTVRKTLSGTRQIGLDWTVRNVPDGRYFLFAKLIPGPGADGDELLATLPRAGRNNTGSATLTLGTCSTTADFCNTDGDCTGSGNTCELDIDLDGNKARLETWTLRLISIQGGVQDWVVNSTLTQPVPASDAPDPDPYPHLLVSPITRTGTYTSIGGEVKFRLQDLSGMSVPNDTFSFTTTGITAPSRGLTLIDGEVNEDPRAAIFATPLSGRPPLTVFFDGRDSVDPNGQPLILNWNFGDGSDEAGGTFVSHTYTLAGTFTASLRVTNSANGRFGETTVDIAVANNSPRARITANPQSGPAPLVVRFSAAQSSDSETAQENLTYQWDFDDGVTANDAGTRGILMETEHFYIRKEDGTVCSATDPCDFVATLTVTDEGGGQDIETVNIRAGNTNPVVLITHTPLEGGSPCEDDIDTNCFEVIFNAGESIDAEGDPLKIRWIWGDGQEDAFDDLRGQDGEGNVVHEYRARTGETTSSFRTTAVIDEVLQNSQGDDIGASIQWPGATVIISERLTGDSDPVAAFTIDPDPPVMNEEFKADGRLSFDRPNGGIPARFVWEWGDGSSTDTGPTAKHTYTEAGQYTIELTVFDDEDASVANTGTRRKTVLVEEGESGQPTTGNRRPTARITASSTTAPIGTQIRFDARGSTDLDEDTLDFMWDFGDGTPRDPRPDPSHAFAMPGTYTVTLTVTDTSNVSDDATVGITITGERADHAPRAVIGTGPRTGTAPLTLTFNGQASFDPNGDALSYRWFRDGQTIESSSSAIAVVQFASAGDYEIKLEVCDGTFVPSPTGIDVCSGLGDISQAEIIRVTARVDGPDDSGIEVAVPDGDGGRNSADQRPSGFCGFGMIFGLAGSLLGLAWMRFVPGRVRLRA